MVTFGLSLLGSLPPGQFVALAKRAEAAGFREIWIPDVVLRGRDVFAYLTLVAIGTGLRFGPGVLHPWTRHLAVAVNAMRTLEEIAPGRAVMGLGSGGAGLAEVGARQARMADLREAVALARRLLAGETVTADGLPATLAEARLRFPTPAALPIWLAATGPKVLRLAGEVADGALLHVGAAPGPVRFALGQVAAGRAEPGAPAAHFEASLYAYASVSESPEAWLRECRGGVASLLARHPAYAGMAGAELALPAGGQAGTGSGFATGSGAAPGAAGAPAPRPTAAEVDAALDAATVRRLAITGGASEWIDRIGSLAEAGLNRITLVATTAEAELIDRAGNDVIPRFG